MAENKKTLTGSDIKRRIVDLSDEISAVARCAGRNADDINLMAVSKFHSAETVRLALDFGHRLFGENRVQEAASKYTVLKKDYPDLSVHLIGPLQTNKVREAALLFDVIETLDRPRLAEALSKEKERTGLCPDLFIQVNTGEEPLKSGVLPVDADSFIEHCRLELKLPVIGLMCIPPINDEPALHFGLLAETARRHGLGFLSMGMSSDFRSAIRLGATHVRIGTAIFGPRPAPTCG
ncbi:MAG: YggS family pyridoxal phosphate-dependent enzyme [Legionellales bacterium]|nr:YggS family pyridoxal phosphate-dependent enzyme [Legionellales bacterium]